MPPDRPRLWESVKRALGGAPTEPVPTPDDLPFLSSEDADAASPPAPVRLPPEDLGFPAAAPPEPPARAESAPPEAPPEPSHGIPEPEPPAPEAASPPGPQGPRLARGLASFSRRNADREKKFRHILSDGDTAKKK